MSSDKKFVNNLISFFFSSGKLVCSFPESNSTDVLVKLLRNLYKKRPKYWKQLLEKAHNHQPDDLIETLRAIYDVISAPCNEMVVLVKSDFKRSRPDKKDNGLFNLLDWEELKSEDAPTYVNCQNYRLIFVNKDNRQVYCRLYGDSFEVVQTLNGKFLFLNTPSYSKLPGHIVKVLLNRGSLYPVLSSDSSRMKLCSNWATFCAERDGIPKKLFSKTRVTVNKIYREALLDRMCCQFARDRPAYDERKCETLCFMAWFGLGRWHRNDIRLFLQNLTREIEEDLDSVNLLKEQQQLANERKRQRKLAVASVTLQALFRGRRARFRVQEMRRQARLEGPALVVQALFRGRCVRLRGDPVFDCPICYQKRFPAPVTTTPCHHKFHNDCLQQWLLRSNRCPLCRGGV